MDENHAGGERVNPGGIDPGAARASYLEMPRSLNDWRRPEATALPGWIKPQLTRLVPEAPDGPDWLHEIKFDGYRMHAGWTGARSGC